MIDIEDEHFTIDMNHPLERLGLVRSNPRNSRIFNELEGESSLNYPCPMDDKYANERLY